LRPDCRDWGGLVAQGVVIEAFPVRLGRGRQRRAAPEPESPPESPEGDGPRGGVLVSLLRFFAEQSRRSTILAIEEPEAFLHPAAQEDLRKDCQALAGRPDCTVPVTTHSPYLVPSDEQSQVVAMAKDREGRTQLVDWS